MNRGEFLKLSCTGCMLGATGLLSVTELLSCAPGTGMKIYKAPVANNTITVPQSKVSSQGVTIVRGKGMDFDIALRQGSTVGTYEALLLRCTHFSNPLLASGNGYHCDLHGSEFDAHGEVLKGPASTPLTALKNMRQGDNIIIYV